MKLIESFLSAPVMEAFGWMILHSLWQGAIISVLLGLIMILTQKFSAKSRYFIACAAFLFMPVISVFTFFRNYTPVIVAIETEASDFNKAEVTQINALPFVDNRTAVQSSRVTESGSSYKTYRKYFSQHIPLIVTVWLLGMLVLGLKFLGGLAYTQRLKHYRIQTVSEEWQEIFNRLCKTLRINRAVSILQSAMVKVPVVIGFFKPVILIPVSAFTGLPPRQLEIIIMHELAHIIRKDYLINILQSLVEIIFFFHPAVWWMSKIIRTEREHCCDDIAMEKTGDSLNYAKALANIQEQFLLKENLAMALSGGTNNQFKRIKRLLNQPNMKTSFTEGFTASCIIFAGVFVMMINTGSSKISDKELLQSETEKVNTEIYIGVDDTAKAAPAPNTDKQYSAEDQLMELEKNNKQASYTLKEDKDAEDVMEEEIIRGVEAGLNRMDIDIIVDEAMAGAEAGINQIDLNLIIDEAIRSARKGVDVINSDIITSEILLGIQSAVEEINLNLIAGEIISGLRIALEEIDVNKIVNSYTKADPGDLTFKGNNEHLDLILNGGVGKWNKWRDENPRIKPDLRGAILTDANLNSIDFHDALLDNINLKEAVLDRANLESASFRYAMLKEASFNGAKLTRADFTGANLKEVSLSGHNLRNTVFNNAEMKEADLSLADMRDSELSYANLREADLTKADLRGANIKGADLSEARLSGTIFKGAIADDFTKFPAGFNPSAEGVIFK